MVQEWTQQNKREEWERKEFQKELIIQKLKEKGRRITRKRKLLLDIILEKECCCCKEIYYCARKLDNKIGTATVYRMLNTLEEIGAISRENVFHIDCDREAPANDKISQ